MKNGPYILKHALMYFVALLLCLGPIAGYVYALKKYQPFIASDGRTTVPAGMQTKNSEIDWNANVRNMRDSVPEAQRVSRKCDAELGNDRLKEAVRAFSMLPASEDGRIEISRKVLNELFIGQEETPTLFTDGWDSSTPTEWIQFSNSKLGIISMSIPYHSAWGNKVFKIVPYEMAVPTSGDAIDTRIHFGKVGVLNRDEGWNSWPLDYSLTIVPHNDAKSLNDELLGSAIMHQGDVVIKTINGHDVVSAKRWIDYAGMYPMIYEIVGSKYNYLLTYNIHNPYDEETMKKIVEGITVE